VDARFPAWFVAFATVAACLIACGGGEEKAAPRPVSSDRPTRPFVMGVSSQPSGPGEDAYKEAFKLAGEAGEVLLIQRAPPWSDFVPGASISDRTERLTRLEKELAKQNRLRLFLAIDPTEPSDRGRLAGLPDDLRGKDFSDGRVRAAFIAYAKYLALNYKPAFLALGVEVDMLYDRRGDGAFRNFLSLYFEAYDAVKSVSSSTLVFPTFQYESLIGKLTSGEPTQPAWSLVPRFEPKIDMLAVSSFPGLIFAEPGAIPDDYYAALRERSPHPLGFTSIGWTSDLGLGGPQGQFDYMSRALAAADALQAKLVVWYLGRDLTPQPASAPQPLSGMGLYDTEGFTKSSWSLWRRHAERPVAP
jgi:hypothetical protein